MKRLVLLVLMGFVSSSFAGVTGNTSSANDLTAIVGNLMGPMQGLAHMLNLASVICGTGFLLAAVLHYKKHRDNPQEVPLSRPVTYLILGLVLVLLPYFTMISQAATFIAGLF